MANIKDVARLANVGTSTVSRYFNKSGYVGDDSKEAILKACKELNYTPNALARAVKTKRSYTICLIVPNISYFFFAEVSAIIQQTCIKRGYKVLLLNADSEKAMREINQSQLHHGFVDGAIVVSAYKGIEEFVYDVPVVFLEKLTQSKYRHSCIYADQQDGAQLACEYLIEQGCKKILYINNEEHYNSSIERMNAYIECMKKHELPVANITLQELAQRGYQSLIEEQYDGVFAWNDYTAAKFMDHCREEAIRIPEDIQLIGYDDVSLAKYLYPQLTTIAQPIESLGIYAADTLINKIEGKQKEEVKIILENKLMVRGTTK